MELERFLEKYLQEYNDLVNNRGYDHQIAVWKLIGLVDNYESDDFSDGYDAGYEEGHSEGWDEAKNDSREEANPFVTMSGKKQSQLVAEQEEVTV